MKTYYTVQNIAEMLGVTGSCVRGWIHAGRLRRDATEDRRTRITQTALESFLDRNPKYKTRYMQKGILNQYLEEKLQVLEELHIYPTGSQIKYMKTLETDVQIDNFAHDLILGKAKVQ